MQLFSALFGIFLLCCVAVDGARILCYFAFPSVSHQNVFRALWKGLALRGHDVVVFTPNPLNDKNLTNLIEYDLSSSYSVVENNPLAKAFSIDLSFIDKQNSIFNLTTNILDYQFGLPEVKRFLNDSTEEFDLVLVHSFFMPVLYGLSHKYRAPVIGVVSFGMPWLNHDSVGNPSHPVIYPDLLLNFGSELSFYQRWLSAYYSFTYRMNYVFNIAPKLDKISKKYFGEETPYILDLEKSVSMQFANVNPVIYKPRPNVPAVVELRMMHLNEVKPLPKDIQAFLDDAKEGAVYFSLGSNIRSSYIDDQLQETIISTLRELPYKVLWKWESEDISKNLSNVLIRTWLPQQDVLAHPNVKVFVTQGGLQSTEEALSNAVPFVSIPFLCDQRMNTAKLTEVSVAIGLNKHTMTKNDLKDAIIEVASNRKYKEKAKELREILYDEPISSVDKAVWWCEYVIRHKGAKFLRSPALDLPLYQYFLLDVIGVTVLAAVLIFYIMYRTVSYVAHVSRRKHKVKVN